MTRRALHQLSVRELEVLETRHLLEGFVAHQKVRGFSERTVKRRVWSLGHWVAHLDTEGIWLGDADGQDVEEFLARWPSAQTRYSVRSDLHQFYAWCIRREHFEFDPTSKTDPPKVPRRLATPIPEPAIRRLFEGAIGPVRTMIMLGACAGLRVSEIAALKAENVDISARVLIVRDGKGSVDDSVPINDQLAIELDGAMERVGGLGPLFPGVDGQGVSYRIRTELRRLGVVGRPHDLRHSFGTQVARQNPGAIRVVQRVMRHRSVTNTERYVAYWPDTHDAVRDLYSA